MRVEDNAPSGLGNDSIQSLWEHAQVVRQHLDRLRSTRTDPSFTFASVDTRGQRYSVEAAIRLHEKTLAQLEGRIASKAGNRPTAAISRQARVEPGLAGSGDISALSSSETEFGGVGFGYLEVFKAYDWAQAYGYTTAINGFPTRMVTVYVSLRVESWSYPHCNKEYFNAGTGTTFASASVYGELTPGCPDPQIDFAGANGNHSLYPLFDEDVVYSGSTVVGA